jgi:hypothetical protein
MELHQIDTMTDAEWDKAISSYDSKYLFHQSSWLNFVKESHNGRIVRLKIVENGNVSGYFCGIIIKKGPLRILGSPLKGWNTTFMGPIVNKGFDYENFLKAIERVCKKWGIHHIEMSNPFLDNDVFMNNKFFANEEITMIVPLSSDEEENWKNLKSECRNRIRKGKKNNLVIQDTDDPAFVDEFYAQLKEVFGRQNLVPTYPVERIKNLFNHLKPAGLLYTLEVKYDNEVVATGVFPYDDRCVYYLGGASWKKAHKLYPNELLHWTVMTMAVQKGIKEYDMTGRDRGNFKAKFGSKPFVYKHYFKSYSPIAKIGREAYKFFFYAQQKIKGKFIKGNSEVQ